VEVDCDWGDSGTSRPSMPNTTFPLLPPKVVMATRWRYGCGCAEGLSPPVVIPSDDFERVMAPWSFSR
jgi:hypothetical protein